MIITRIAPFVFGFIQLLIIVACIIIVTKKTNIGTIIMLIGAILSGLMDIVRPIVYAMDFSDFMLTNNILTVLSAIFYGVFGLGLLLFAIDLSKPNK